MLNVKSFRIFVIVLFLSVLAVHFNNCSRAEYGLVKASIRSAPPVAPPDTVVQIKTTCDEAATANDGTLITSNLVVYFKDTANESGRKLNGLPNNICQWGTNGSIPNSYGNIAKQNLVVTARYTQYRPLNIPINAVLCDLDITSNEPSTKYDDIFFMTFNNYVVATNGGVTSDFFDKQQMVIPSTATALEVKSYNWDKIVGTTFTPTFSDYCLGEGIVTSNCSWPISESTGTFNLDIDQEALIALSAELPDTQKHEFGLIVTGDNNSDKDCYHSDINLNVTAKYIIPTEDTTTPPPIGGFMVTSVNLVNTSTDVVAQVITQGTTFSASGLPLPTSKSMSLNVSGTTTSRVRMTLYKDNMLIKQGVDETLAPYSLCGNTGNNFWTCSNLDLTAGSYNLEVQLVNKSGQILSNVNSISFTITP